MTNNKHYHMVDEKDYKQVKRLLSYGLKPKKIKELLNRSLATLYQIDKSTSLKNYRELGRLAVAKRSKAEPVEPEVVEPEIKVADVKGVHQKNFDQFNSLVTILKSLEYNQMEQIDLLKKIAKNLG